MATVPLQWLKLFTKWKDLTTKVAKGYGNHYGVFASKLPITEEKEDTHK